MDHIFSRCSLFANINALLNTLMLTLVEVGERFIMQFNSRRGRCTQNILKGKDHILIFWRQAGLLLLEDGKGKNITGGKKDTYITCTVINTVNPDYPTQTLRPLLSTVPYLQTHDKNKSNSLTRPIIINRPIIIIGHTLSQLCASYWGCYGNSNKFQSIHSGSHCSFQLKNFSQNMAWGIQ